MRDEAEARGLDRGVRVERRRQRRVHVADVVDLSLNAERIQFVVKQAAQDKLLGGRRRGIGIRIGLRVDLDIANEASGDGREHGRVGGV